MIPNEVNSATPRRCANETCARAAEPDELYCPDCGLEMSLYLRESRVERAAAGRGAIESARRVEELRETARRLFGG